MKISHAFLLIISACLLSCNSNLKKENKQPEKDYIFFLHNKFLEDNASGALEQKYNTKAEYNEIIESFRKDGFVVISEKREPKTNGIAYVQKVVKQIDSLIAIGVNPRHITVVGTSKGGYIAQFISTYAENPGLNFVFIGSYQESDLKALPAINFCGNILTIYEKSDTFGVSAIKRKELSKLPVGHFREIEVNTGLKHGFLYLALDEWIQPSKMWARRNYDLKE